MAAAAECDGLQFGTGGVGAPGDQGVGRPLLPGEGRRDGCRAVVAAVVVAVKEETTYPPRRCNLGQAAREWRKKGASQRSKHAIHTTALPYPGTRHPKSHSRKWDRKKRGGFFWWWTIKVPPLLRGNNTLTALTDYCRTRAGNGCRAQRRKEEQ